jgi:DMSO/TMAO reductase YedYZ molybdopterin-dependent catalytic subunit
MNTKALKILILCLSIFLMAAMVAGVAGCSSSTSTSTSSSSTTATQVKQTNESPALTVTKGEQTATYTMTALKAMTPLTGWAGQMSSTGTISGPFEYKGVAISDVLQAVGGITEENAVRVSAKDGYAMTLSYKQITEGNFTIIDSNTGKEVTAANKPAVFVAYEEAGKPIDENIGPLRLGIMTSNSQVTEGHWWVKWTQKIEVISVQKPWNLKLEGVVSENMDQGTFESGSAIGCHGVKWTDDQNRAWEGIPLWYLVGRVDDTDTHKGDAFNDAAADKGYEVQLIAADGFIQKLTSAEVKRNDALIVAYKRDGNPLPENQWPLRLVGATLKKEQMVGQITTIKLVFDVAAASPSPTAAGETVLTVTKGSQTKTFTLAEIKALTPLSGYSGTKNKAGVVAGPMTYTGAALTDILTAVGGLASGNSVKFTAKDGYSKTLTYDQITQGTFTTYDTAGNAADPEMKPVVFVAYEIDGKALEATAGPLQLAVMTCPKQVTDGSNFIKQLEKIEVVTP